MMYVHIIITLFLMFGFGFLPPFATLTPMGMRLLGTFLGVIYGYSTRKTDWNTEWKTSTDRYSSADQKGINSYC